MMGRLMGRLYKSQWVVRKSMGMLVARDTGRVDKIQIEGKGFEILCLI